MFKDGTYAVVAERPSAHDGINAGSIVLVVKEVIQAVYTRSREGVVMTYVAEATPQCGTEAEGPAKARTST
jgi:hypothetical protein